MRAHFPEKRLVIEPTPISCYALEILDALTKFTTISTRLVKQKKCGFYRSLFHLDYTRETS